MSPISFVDRLANIPSRKLSSGGASTRPLLLVAEAHRHCPRPGLIVSAIVARQIVSRCFDPPYTAICLFHESISRSGIALIPGIRGPSSSTPPCATMSRMNALCRSTREEHSVVFSCRSPHGYDLGTSCCCGFDWWRHYCRLPVSLSLGVSVKASTPWKDIATDARAEFRTSGVPRMGRPAKRCPRVLSDRISETLVCGDRSDILIGLNKNASRRCFRTRPCSCPRASHAEICLHR